MDEENYSEERNDWPAWDAGDLAHFFMQLRWNTW